MEPLTQSLIIPIQDHSQVAVARRLVSELGENAGLDSQRISATNVVTVELANNLLQHAAGGHLYVRFLQFSGALEIAAVDHGKGMLNVEQCVADGYSTGSTPGLGLGAVKRFAVRFSAYSLSDRATVVTARMTESKPAPEFSVVSVAMHGEALSGDSWRVSDDGTTFLLIDGLGHGILAAEAARVGVELFQKHEKLPIDQILQHMHSGMRATRGAAAAIARVRNEANIIEFAGIGNIACMLMNPARTQSFVSHNGTLGHQVRRIQVFQYAYSARDLLLMQSDGISVHSKKGIPASLLAQSPSVIAPLIYSEQARDRDDATVLVNRLA